MGKSSTAPLAPQSTNGPTVLIKYSSEKSLAIIGEDARQITKELAAIQITNQKTLEASITATENSQSVLDRIEQFRTALVDRVREAGERIAEADEFYKGLKIGVVLQQWPAKTELENEQKRVKTARAQYLDKQEQARIAEQQRVDAEQRKKNEKVAEKAVGAARESGADPATVKEIKREILQAPAPIVESLAVEIAKESGVGLQYDYTAEIFHFRKFLTLCLNNEVFLNTLMKIQPQIEGAFRSMAVDQKEKFMYDGIRFKKTPKDVQSRRRG